MFVLSLVIAIAFLLLLKNFPGCMVYTMIVLIIILFVALIVLGIVYEIYGLSIGFGIALLILIIVLFCFRDKIKTGILLLKVAADFLTEKPSVYLAPFYPMLMGTIFFAFWVFTFLEIVFDKAIKDSKNPP